MSGKVKLIPITELESYRDGKLNLRPEANGLEAQLYYEEGGVFLFQEAKRAAKEVNSICIAVFKSRGTEYVFSTEFSKGNSVRMKLFNSTEASATDGEVETYISDVEDSNAWIKFALGSFN